MPVMVVHHTPSLTRERYEAEPPKSYPAHTYISV